MKLLIYTRLGKQLELPQKFYNFLPKKEVLGNFLDGEIWFGRGQYSFAYMLLAGSEGDYWQHFKFVSSPSLYSSIFSLRSPVIFSNNFYLDLSLLMSRLTTCKRKLLKRDTMQSLPVFALIIQLLYPNKNITIIQNIK